VYEYITDIHNINIAHLYICIQAARVRMAYMMVIIVVLCIYIYISNVLNLGTNCSDDLYTANRVLCSLGVGIMFILWGPCTVDLNNLYRMGVLPRALSRSVFIFIRRVQLTSVIYIVLAAEYV